MVESLMELPPNNIEQIISKLPIKSILACRCVCKTFLNLTSSSNPHFTALHSSNASQNLIIQFGINHGTLLNSVHLFDARLDINPVSSDEKLRLSPIFKIPDWAKELDRFVLVNACNGLLFFAVTKLKDRCSLVCNPITNEYVRVPEVDQKRQLHTQTSSLWLGFSPISRVYKVLRIYVHSPGAIPAANIHDIGSSSWRDVESTPLDNIYWDYSYAFINGIIYWFCQYDFLFCRPAANFIVFFDFESEIFGKIDAPPGFDEYKLQRRYSMNIGIGGDLLCLIDSSESLDIWLVDKCGSWNKQLISSVDAVKNPRIGTKLRPLQLLSSWEILMVSGNPRNLVYIDMKRNSFRLIKLHIHSRVVTFVPSFVSLKDALIGN